MRTEIEYIKNLSIISNKNDFDYTLNNLSDGPHELIIRQITFKTQMGIESDDILLLWCNLTNAYVSSLPLFQYDYHNPVLDIQQKGCSNTYPNRTIYIKESLNKNINFKVHKLYVDGTINNNDKDGVIVIQADIIKYKV